MTEQTALGYAIGLEARGYAAEASELRRLSAVNAELLEALKNYVDGCSVGVNATEVARAAIKKAEET